MSETKKLDYMDYFRGIAILFVVAGHTMCWGSSTMFQVNWLLLTGGTYLFVFIAGFLFQYLSYKFNIKDYYKKKLINVISPYFFVILPFACFYAFYNPQSSILNSSSPIARFIAILLNGACVNQPLWFIGMISIIFLISPFILMLKKKNKKIYITLFICSLVYTLISKRYAIDTMASPFYKFILVNLLCYFKNCFHFLFFYLLGMELSDLISKYYNKIKQNLNTILYISLFIYIFHFIVHLFIIKKLDNIQVISRMISIFVLLSGLMLFEEKIKKSNVVNKSLKFLAQYSFGIFFIHAYIENWLYKSIGTKPSLLIKMNDLHSCISALCVFFVVLSASVLFLFLIKTILNKLGVKNTRKFIGV